MCIVLKLPLLPNLCLCFRCRCRLLSYLRLEFSLTLLSYISIFSLPLLSYLFIVFPLTLLYLFLFLLYCCWIPTCALCLRYCCRSYHTCVLCFRYRCCHYFRCRRCCTDPRQSCRPTYQVSWRKDRQIDKGRSIERNYMCIYLYRYIHM